MERRTQALQWRRKTLSTGTHRLEVGAPMAPHQAHRGKKHKDAQDTGARRERWQSSMCPRVCHTFRALGLRASAGPAMQRKLANQAKGRTWPAHHCDPPPHAHTPHTQTTTHKQRLLGISVCDPTRGEKGGAVHTASDSIRNPLQCNDKTNRITMPPGYRSPRPHPLASRPRCTAGAGRWPICLGTR